VTAHRTDILPTRFLGARRFQARCEGCPWEGELRREREDAEQDGALHEATAPQPEPKEQTSGVGFPD
jgi:hypothetical protein